MGMMTFRRLRAQQSEPPHPIATEPLPPEPKRRKRTPAPTAVPAEVLAGKTRSDIDAE